MKTILIMGLPESGKTSLSDAIKDAFVTGTVMTINADEVREKANDWDFTPEGRIRQANRMVDLVKEIYEMNMTLTEEFRDDYVMVDFICPTVETRRLFNADIVIWCDTVKDCQYEDTNSQFQRPQFSKENIHCYVTTKNAQFWAKHIIDTILCHPGQKK